jgi:nucleotide-binding universal stress UspA family protein
MLTAVPAPIRLIVAATDLSPAADQAVAKAAVLAAQWGAELCLLHVFDDSLWATIKAVYDAERWSAHEPILAARDRLSRQARELGERHGIVVRAETRTGGAASAIADFVREQQAQLLVVGEHSEEWIADTVIGGTALKVLEQASVPVLLVRRPADADFSAVLTATDFSDNAKRAARWLTTQLPGARHFLLHAYAVAFEGRMRMAGATDADIERYRGEELGRATACMDEQLAQLGSPARIEPLLAHGAPVAVLLSQAERVGANLLVIGKHGGTVLEERLLGSVTQNVLYHARCDVLLVP